MSAYERSYWLNWATKLTGVSIIYNMMRVRKEIWSKNQLLSWHLSKGKNRVFTDQRAALVNTGPWGVLCGEAST